LRIAVARLSVAAHLDLGSLGSMSKSSRQDQRQAWTTPKLRRIEAGSAEADPSGLKVDGGKSPNHKIS
jgi:hypothetical protein